MDTSSVLKREPRSAISLRLPPPFMQAIEQYAAKHRLSKTDAFIHFLSKGIEVEERGDPGDVLTQIERKVTETLRLVRNQQGISDKGRVIDAVRNACGELPAIKRAFLFGSFARGTFDDESDIDLRLEIDESAHFNLRDLEHFSKRVEEATGRSVDAVTARIIKNRALENAIERDKELIYDRQEK